VRECARLQTFPDDYEFVKQGDAKISASEAYKLVGNAVPPFLGFHIAWRLQELWPKLFK
jgi:DNA (cytosine-5)-methyltransferase 1